MKLHAALPQNARAAPACNYCVLDLCVHLYTQSAAVLVPYVMQTFPNCVNTPPPLPDPPSPRPLQVLRYLTSHLRSGSRYSSWG